MTVDLAKPNIAGWCDVGKILNVLEGHLEWLRSVARTAPSPADADRAADLVRICVGLLGQSIRGYQDWVTHGDRMPKIRRCRDCGDPRVNKRLRELVALTLSDVSACRPFKPFRWVDCDFLDRQPPPAVRQPRTIARRCVVCERPFEATRADARFCSSRCRQRARRVCPN